MDLNNILNLDKLKENKQLVFIIVVMAITAFLGKKIWDKQKVQLSDINSKIENYQQMISLAGDINKLSKDFEQFKGAGWLTNESVAIMGEVNDLARKHAIEIITFDPAGFSDQGNYSTLALNLNLKSEYFSLVRFLSELEELKTLTKISSVTIAPEGDTGEASGPYVRANLTIVAFIMKK